ncbi:MAG: hypothetical protein PHC75_07965 [Burkholderiales bacterium]|nr:hypothetical protein [Burkholderiales bacterium]
MNDESKAKEDRPVPRLYLIRGIPGSGKTRYSHNLGCITIAPSDMMSHRGGQYTWVSSNYMISKIHFRKIVRDLMALQIDICITELLLEKRFIDFWLKEAKDNYYQVRIGTILVDLKTSEQRNLHGVNKTAVKEIHDQMDYGIPDQIIDYSEGEWSKSKVNVEKPYGFIPDESNHYGLIWDDDAGHEIKQLINENQLDRAMELHIKTGKMYENYKPKILE